MDKKLKACLLARVSTKSLKQESSIDNQIGQLSSIILNNPIYEFDPNKDIFYEQFTGTKIVRSNTQKGFNALMQMLGIDIVDTKNKDIIELQVKANRNIKPYYDVIFCKSTSRFSRASYKGESVVYLLKELGVDIYYYDLNKLLSQMSDEEIKLYSLIDNKYSKTVAFNHRNSFMLKNNNREILTKGEKFGFEKIRKNDKKIYFIKKDDEAKIFNLMKDLFNNGYGCERIANYLNENGYKNNMGAQFSKSKIHNILNDPNYCGYEYYYNLPKEYLTKFGVDREYLKQVPKELDKCDYIEAIEPLEDYLDRLETFKKRTKDLKGKYGVKQNFSPISKLCICGYCLKNGNGIHHYYSKGTNSNYKKGDRAFICTSKRKAQKYREIECKSKAFYESYFYEKIEHQTKFFIYDLHGVCDFAIHNLENLKIHLLLLLDNNYDNSIIELKKEEKHLKEKLKKLLLDNLSSSVGLEVVEGIKKSIDNRLLEIQNNLFQINTLLVQISKEIDNIDNLIKTIKDSELDLKTKLSVDEMLQLLDHILVLPKNGWKSNSVVFFPISKVEIEVNHLIEEIFNMELIKLLDKNLISEHVNPKTLRKSYIVKNPTSEQKERATLLLEEV